MDIISTHTQNLAPFINTFVHSLDVKDSSRQTYARGIQHFFTWAANQGHNLANMDRNQILEYKSYLIRTKSVRTAAGYLNCVRQFYQYAESMKMYPNIARSIKAPKKDNVYKRQPLTADQARQLIMYYKETQCKRDYAIVNILIHTGVRTAELISANIADLTTREGMPVLIVKKKGSDAKESMVKLTTAAYDALIDYMNTERSTAGENEAIFVSRSNHGRNERITTRSIRRIVEKGLQAIGINDPNISAHSLRHTGATLVYDATQDIEAVRLFCRHQSINTTQIYIHTREATRAIHNKAYDVLSGILAI